MSDRKYDLTMTLPSVELDKTFAIYPLYVLTANRMVNTILQRRQRTSFFRFHHDFKDMKKINGLKSWIAGIVPFTISWFIAEESASEEEENDSFRNLATMLFVCTYNPLQMMTLRMQCCDYKHRFKFF